MKHLCALRFVAAFGIGASLAAATSAGPPQTLKRPPTRDRAEVNPPPPSSAPHQSPTGASEGNSAVPAPPPTPDAAFDPTPYSGREAIDADFEALIKKYFEWKKEQADSQSKQVAAESIALDKEVKKLLPKPEALKPLPLTPIPDDPPPHEGALIDLPCIIEPPDLIIVEVLEALPGRPISGERLVRPTVVLTSDSMVRFMCAA